MEDVQPSNGWWVRVKGLGHGLVSVWVIVTIGVMVGGRISRPMVLRSW